MFRGAGHADAAAAAELEHAFIAEQSQGAEHGIGVHAQHCGQILGRGEPFTGLGLAVGDGAADLACDLLVEVGGVGLVYLDIQHGASNTSAISAREVAMTVHRSASPKRSR